MMRLVCADAGTVCPAVINAHTHDELMRRLAHHLSDAHRVRAPNRTILDYMAGLAREGMEP